MTEAKFWSPNGKDTKSFPDTSKKLVTKDLGQPARRIFGGLKNMSKALAKISLVTIPVLLVLGVGLYLILVRPVFKVFNSYRVLKDDVGVINKAFIDRDLVTVEKTLEKTSTDLAALHDAIGKNLPWMQKFGPTKGYYSDSEKFVNAGYYLIDGVKEAVELIKPFADAAGLRVSEEEEIEEKSLVEAFSNWIAVMPQVAAGSDAVIAKFVAAGEELSQVDSKRYPEKIFGREIRINIVRTQNILTKLNDAGPDIKSALTIVPGLLGVGTAEQRYMIIMQNDKELRPTGGFWTNYATFKIGNAMLSSDFTSKDMYSIDDTLAWIDATYDFPDAPPAYMKYLKLEHWFARDMNNSPDFVTSVDQFIRYYNLAGQIDPSEIKPVQGVFAIDTQVLKELMEVTGPVTVNGITYDSENVVLELEKIASLSLQQQKGRKRVLGDLMEAMLVNVFESESNLWSTLIDKGINLAMRKHIQIYLFDPQAQALVEKYNLGGRIVDPVEGDYSMVVSTNLGGDKTNWFVKKQVDHELTQENGKWVRTVKITYTYEEPTGEYALFAKRFRDWVRVYAPEGSALISVEGSADTFGEAVERGKVYFDGYTELGPGESTVMTFKYYLPDGVIAGDVYNLYLQKQAGVNGEAYTITAKGKTEKLELSKDYKYSTKL